MRRRRDARRHLTIGPRGVPRCCLVKRRREPEGCTVSKEDDVVQMPIGIRDESTERIEPLKTTRIVTRQPASVSQANRRTSP